MKVKELVEKTSNDIPIHIQVCNNSEGGIDEYVWINLDDSNEYPNILNREIIGFYVLNDMVIIYC